jgi:hypothetical protein
MAESPAAEGQAGRMAESPVAEGQAGRTAESPAAKGEAHENEAAVVAAPSRVSGRTTGGRGRGDRPTR